MAIAQMRRSEKMIATRTTSEYSISFLDIQLTISNTQFDHSLGFG
jgi:hypothetical protein